MLTRRRFFENAAAAGISWMLPKSVLADPFAVRFRRSLPFEDLFEFIEPGHDEFAGEKQASQITAHLDAVFETRALPLSDSFEGASPLPRRYRQAVEDVLLAEFDPLDRDFEQGLKKWLDSLGQIRSARFFVLPKERIRYEISSAGPDELRYRVGIWKQSWSDGRLLRFEPIEETLVTSPRMLFQDVTSQVFRDADSFQLQMRPGVPYWRARLDSACGIDVYGNNGIAVGDVDGDGWDEVYVCQPGGLPNRLYKDRGGVMEDITEQAGVGVLDDTTCALFVDFRNTGRQDLVVLTKDGPLLFLNQGRLPFLHKPAAFRFASPPQGTFTGMAAADYDLDGRVDLYLCTYIYFQSEDQYRYPVPYHDSQNGPPNFLFHNELTGEGGFFEDVTARVGMNENNNRYSFAPAWCDFDGDGWPDLYVANDFGRNNLYKNERGRFHDIAAAAGVADVGPGMSAAWFDYDADGLQDLYVSNMWTAAGQRVVEDKAFAAAPNETLRNAYRRHSKGNSLFHNRGDGAFESTEAAEGVEMGRWAWASDGIDFDNDGTPEIYITCGMLTNSSTHDLMSFFWRQVVSRSPAANIAAPAYENGWNALNQLIRGDYSWNGREPNVLYARRLGHFYDFSGVSGLDLAEDSRAFAVTDLDGDGSLDLLLKSRLGPQVRAFQNDWGQDRHSIALELQGTRSNRDAIGVRVEVEHSDKRTTRTLQAGSGYISQHTKRLYFGLGNASSTGRVRILWPSGLTQDFENLAAGFRHQIVEGSDQLKSVAFLPRKPLTTAPAAITGDNRTNFEPAWLLEPVPLPEPPKGRGFLCLFSGQKPIVPQGLPFQMVDLGSGSSDLRALYALYRMYLFDYRVDLTLPLLLLADERGMAHKVYEGIPEPDRLRADLAMMQDKDRIHLALPFAGTYYAPPRRNYFRLGAAFYWAGYPRQALIYMEEALRSTPDNSKAHLAVGHIHLEAGSYGPARKHLEMAVKLSPGSADAWINLGSLETALENYAAGLQDFEKALAILPDSAFALLSTGRAHGKLGHALIAERMLRRVLEIEPKNAEASNQLGLLLSGQNRNEEARKSFQDAIAAARDHTGAINNLGVLYMQTQKPQDAIAAFRYGIEVAPDEELLYFNLARAYVAVGDRMKARDVLQRLLVRHPDSVMGKKGLAELGAP